GYTVLVAQGGREALETSAGHAGLIELLVTDVIMPQMSGRQLADRLRAARPGLRVLYISGYTGESISHHGVPDDGIAFLAKPFLPAELARKVREVLDRREG
ncbi:MAG TPA: response regulator, partial [Gemmataceae bacterium]